MTNFLKRFFLFFFPIVACLFLVYLLIPVAASAHTTRLFTTKSSGASSYASLMQAATPTPISTPVAVTPTPTMVPPTPVPTPTMVPPTPVPAPTTLPTPVAVTPTAVPTPTPTLVPTPIPTPIPTLTPTAGGNTNATSAHVALNGLIFTMGGTGMLLVIVGAILYFVYSRPG